MKAIVIACEMIREELEFTMKEINCTFPVKYLNAGLHNTPKLLGEQLQEVLNGLSGQSYDTVLFTFGSCGNATLGLKTGDFTLVVPRVDDCISLLLGSVQRRAAINHEAGTYFLTPGWMRGDQNLWAEYQQAIRKYGRKRAERIMGAMLHNYRNLALLETGCYQSEAYFSQVEAMAKELGLTPCLLPATTDYIRELLTGPWEEGRFAVVPPSSYLTSL